MNCRRIEKLIPLYVEGDLESHEAGTVLAHLKTCESCGALVTEYEASQTWLRSHALPDFDDAMLDDLKRGVMREIDEAKERPAFFGFFAGYWTPGHVFQAIAALLIIVAAVAFYVYLGKLSGISNNDKIATEKSVPGESPAPKDVKQAPGADPAVIPPRVRRHVSKAPGRSMIGRKPDIERMIVPRMDKTFAQGPMPESQDVSDKTEEMMRMEIQTDDPNVRIIWFSPKEADSQLSKPMIETD
jgi:hypothetical protein